MKGYKRKTIDKSLFIYRICFMEEDRINKLFPNKRIPFNMESVDKYIKHIKENVPVNSELGHKKEIVNFYYWRIYYWVLRPLAEKTGVPINPYPIHTEEKAKKMTYQELRDEFVKITGIREK